MKRLILILSIFLLTACSSNQIPEGFVESEIKNKVEEVVGLINEFKLDEVTSMFRDDLKTMVKVADLETIIQTKIDQVGQFKEISQIAITDTKDPNTSEVYAVAIVVCEHEKGRTTYTLSFNESLELVGFFIK